MNHMRLAANWAAILSDVVKSGLIGARSAFRGRPLAAQEGESPPGRNARTPRSGSAAQGMARAGRAPEGAGRGRQCRLTRKPPKRCAVPAVAPIHWIKGNSDERRSRTGAPAARRPAARAGAIPPFFVGVVRRAGAGAPPSRNRAPLAYAAQRRRASAPTAVTPSPIPLPFYLNEETGEPEKQLFYHGERGVLAFGLNGAGKATRSLIELLMTSVGRSILVLDIKGELAAQTAEERQKIRRREDHCAIRHGEPDKRRLQSRPVA